MTTWQWIFYIWAWVNAIMLFAWCIRRAQHRLYERMTQGKAATDGERNERY